MTLKLTPKLSPKIDSPVYTTHDGLEPIFRAHRWLIGEKSQVNVEKLPGQCGETSKALWRNFQSLVEKLPEPCGETPRSMWSCKMQCSRALWKTLQSLVENSPVHCGDPSSPLWRPSSPNSEDPPHPKVKTLLTQ